jgi:hypothetical protein
VGETEADEKPEIERKLTRLEVLPSQVQGEGHEEEQQGHPGQSPFERSVSPPGDPMEVPEDRGEKSTEEAETDDAVVHRKGDPVYILDDGSISSRKNGGYLAQVGQKSIQQGLVGGQPKKDVDGLDVREKLWKHLQEDAEALRHRDPKVFRGEHLEDMELPEVYAQKSGQ